MTDRVRKWILACFVVSCLVTLGGWIAGKDPNQLTTFLLMLLGALGVGEASNIGKRATVKPELMKHAETK